jgi:AbrB family looped-hinge helix DNA binding protein
MAEYATTKLSSKGQVVIPEDIRERLHLKEGDQFVVIGQGDAVILKAITPPSMDEFKGLLKEARATAKQSKATQSDVKAAIKKARKA